jgi:disulfide bond formation protein DsbB
MLENMLLLNWWVATGVLFLEIGVIGKLISLILVTYNSDFRNFILEISKNIKDKFNIDVLSEKFLIFFIFVFSLFSSILTQVYSEIFLQVPCALCWWQRVFMYGVVVISGTSLFARNNQEEKGIIKYLLNFSILGFGFAIYQHAMQMFALYGTHLPCPVSGADCSKMTLFEYGHITFPWMAVVLFGFFIAIIFLHRRLK